MWCAGQYIGYRSEEGVAAESETGRSSPLSARSTNWRWAGVLFSCVPASVSPRDSGSFIASANRRRACFPRVSGVGSQGPDHLTFDLADASKMSLSFYGKRTRAWHATRQAEPAIPMRDTGLIGDVLEATNG